MADSFSDASRPSSAHSNTTFATAITQRPDSHDGPDPLLQGIAHLQTLLSLQSGIGAASHDNGRPRSASSALQTQSRMLQELETLKRQVWRSSHVGRRPSQFDVDDGGAAFPDEKEEEVQRLREELQLLRQQRDKEMEAAEKQITSLTEERDGLGKSSEHVTDMDELRKILDLERQEHAKVEQSRVALQAENEKLREQLESPSTPQQRSPEETEEMLAAREMAVAEYTQRISNLEEANRLAGEQMQSLITTHKEREDSLLQQHTELQARHGSLTSELKSSQAKAFNLEREANDHDLRRRELTEELNNHKDLLKTANEEAESHSREATQLRNDYQTTKNARDEFETLLQDALVCTTQLEGKIRAADRRAVQAEAALNSTDSALSRELSERNEELAEIRVEVLSMQGQLTEAHGRAAEAEAELEETHSALSVELLSKENELVQLQDRLAELQRQHDEAITAAESQKTDAEAAHHRDLEALQAKHMAEVVQKDTSHQNELQSALEAARESSIGEITFLKDTHQQTVKQLHRELERANEERLAKQEEKHEAMLGAALADADDDMEGRLRDQERVHGEELENLRESLSVEVTKLQRQLHDADALRQAQMHTVETANERVVQDLGDKLMAAEKLSAELSTNHATLTAELSALQARLDAELMAHAEAELALADLRKRQRASLGEKRVGDDTKEALQRQVVVLQAEVDSLSKRQETPSPSLNGSRSARLSQMSGGSAEAEELSQRNSELARQNEFLVKELETVMSRIGTPQSNGRRSQDIAIQTEPEAPARTFSPSGRIISRSRDGTSGPATYVPTGQAEGRARAGSARSLVAYLERAEIELSGLGRAASNSEKLFAIKVEEYAGDVQLVKGRLDQEYQDQCSALLAEKKQMEKIISAKSAADFSKDRLNLLVSYGASHEGSIEGFSTPTRQALRNAEGRLVAEHDKRLMMRTSEIALKHVADLQALTEEYDRKVSHLLSDRDKPEVDMSTARSMSPSTNSTPGHKPAIPGPSKRDSFNRSTPLNGSRVDSKNDLHGVETTDFAVSTPDQARVGHFRTKTLSRTSSSIPRAVPYAGRPVASDLTTPRNRNTVLKVATDRFPPRQSSLQPHTPDTESGDQEQSAKITTSPQNYEARPSTPLADDLAERNFGTVSPIAQHSVLQSRNSQKKPRTLDKKRSFRHSSGLIYLQS